jgi:UDP-glucose 4-epimerase
MLELRPDASLATRRGGVRPQGNFAWRLNPKRGRQEPDGRPYFCTARALPSLSGPSVSPAGPGKRRSMRVVIVGATGNVGTSLLEALALENAVESILGLARRRPLVSFEKTEWVEAEIATDDLEAHFRGASAVIHLAWTIQPSHDLAALRRTNVEGSARVFRAVARADVPTLIYASSVGVYSPGPKDRFVDEGWPRQGVSTSFYARHKAEVEALLDRFERERPEVRVVRMRPALIFKREAGSEIRRLFLGPFFPSRALRLSLIPVVPDVPGLRFQAVHSHDVADAYRLALLRDVSGAFNLAARPALDGPRLARTFGVRGMKVPASVARGATGLTWRLRLQPTPAGWVDLALGVPLMDVQRATAELGWQPRRAADEALLELVEGIRMGAGIETPPLSPHSGSVGPSGEVARGVSTRKASAFGANGR